MKALVTFALLALFAITGEAEAINWNFLDQTDFYDYTTYPGQSAKTESSLTSTQYGIKLRYEGKLFYPGQIENPPELSGTHDLHVRASESFANNFLLAVVERGSYFAGEGASNNWLDLEGMSNANLPTDYYLGIVIQDKFGDRYGWIQLHYDEDAHISIAHQALDMDGDTILVGMIPEPTSGFLLLVGTAFLALRRRRGL